MIQEAATKTIPVDVENSPEASGRVGLFTCSRKKNIIIIFSRGTKAKKNTNINCVTNLIDFDIEQLIQSYNINIHEYSWDQSLNKETVYNVTIEKNSKI